MHTYSPILSPGAFSKHAAMLGGAPAKMMGKMKRLLGISKPTSGAKQWVGQIDPLKAESHLLSASKESPAILDDLAHFPGGVDPSVYPGLLERAGQASPEARRALREGLTRDLLSAFK